MNGQQYLWLAFGAGLLAASVAHAADQPGAPGRVVAPGVLEVGRLRHPRLTECSGVAASRQYPGVFWVHNDGGGPKRQVLYAVHRDGSSVAEFPVIAVMDDWEDIAIDGEKHLYLGDIGNNDAKRSTLAVHQVNEPDPQRPNLVAVTRSWRLTFPQAPFDCESLFVWGTNGYVVSKVFRDQRAEIFRFSLAEASSPITLERVAKLKIDSPVTGADLSPDGRLLGLVAKAGAFVYPIDGDVSRASKAKPYQVKFRHEHIEGCAFVPEGLLATAESREIFLFTDEAFR